MTCHIVILRKSLDGSESDGNDLVSIGYLYYIIYFLIVQINYDFNTPKV
jgi:hypothetical protein